MTRGGAASPAPRACVANTARRGNSNRLPQATAGQPDEGRMILLWRPDYGLRSRTATHRESVGMPSPSSRRHSARRSVRPHHPRPHPRPPARPPGRAVVSRRHRQLPPRDRSAMPRCRREAFAGLTTCRSFRHCGFSPVNDDSAARSTPPADRSPGRGRPKSRPSA